MRFTPKTEKEVAEEGLLPKGTYSFEVADATNKQSKAGNDMIELKLHVFDDAGNPRIIFDYLLEQLSYKLRHAAVACGLLDKYEQGDLDAADFIGRSGEVNITINKDKSAQYPDKNNVADYVPKEQPTNQKSSPVDLNDEIPF